MKFQVSYWPNDTVVILAKNRRIAIFDLDYAHQLSKVTIFESSTPEERLAVLRLAGWHTSQYVIERERSIFGDLLLDRIGSGQSDLQRSLGLLETTNIPEGIPGDYTVLVELLKLVGIPVISAVYDNYELALDHAVNDSRLMAKVNYEIADIERYDNRINIRFIVEEPAKFRFWHVMSRVGNLDVIPSYHPEMRGKRYGQLINGATDALIGCVAIPSVYAPTESRLVEQEGIFSSSWTHMKHPAKAEGHSFMASVSTRHILSTEGMSTLVDLLATALELSNTYVGISGGFRSPYGHPGNVVRRYGIHPARGEVRGSESSCAWTYHTLQAEDLLEGSYVPDWFLGESWLNAYPAPSKADAPL